MGENGQYESCGEVIEINQTPIDWLQDHITPELAGLVVGGVIIICLCGAAGGKSVSLKLGPLMLSIV